MEGEKYAEFLDRKKADSLYSQFTPMMNYRLWEDIESIKGKIAGTSAYTHYFGDNIPTFEGQYHVSPNLLFSQIIMERLAEGHIHLLRDSPQELQVLQKIHQLCEERSHLTIRDVIYQISDLLPKMAFFSNQGSLGRKNGEYYELPLSLEKDPHLAFIKYYLLDLIQRLSPQDIFVVEGTTTLSSEGLSDYVYNSWEKLAAASFGHASMINLCRLIKLKEIKLPGHLLVCKEDVLKDIMPTGHAVDSIIALRPTDGVSRHDAIPPFVQTKCLVCHDETVDNKVNTIVRGSVPMNEFLDYLNHPKPGKPMPPEDSGTLSKKDLEDLKHYLELFQ